MEINRVKEKIYSIKVLVLYQPHSDENFPRWAWCSLFRRAG
jgi:hypothetical protein